MDMKLRGMYIARQLSFHGVSFKIEEVPLSPEFTLVYDNAVKLVWLLFYLLLNCVCMFIFYHILVGGCHAYVPRSS